MMFVRCYFAPDEPPAGEGNPDGADAAKQANAENAAQRLLAKAQKERDEALTATERLKREAADAKKQAESARREALLLKVGKDLPDEALEFLTGADEATLTAQAEKLKGMFGTRMEPKAPVTAGTKTHPGGQQQPTAQEKIAGAVKAGNTVGAISLMRDEQFGKR